MIISECIAPQRKQNHVEWGDADIFGQDSDKRKKFALEEASARFNEVWLSKLEPELQANSEEISHEQARELLKSIGLEGYVQRGYEFWQFDLHRVPFLARMKKTGEDQYVCDQLWTLGKHKDNTRLCMYFDTVEEKKRFDMLARHLGWEPKILALHLAMDFMRKFPDHFPGAPSTQAMQQFVDDGEPF